MKAKLLTLVFVCLAMAASAQTMRVAILDVVDREGKISYSSKLMLRSNLSKAVTNTPGYEAYDRSDMDAIMGEQNFQRTGMVSNDQIKRLGIMTGANYILVAEATMADAQYMYITAKILDVETARTIITDNEMMKVDANSIQQGCIALAHKMFDAKQMEKKGGSSNTATAKSNSAAKEKPAAPKEKKIELVKNTKDDKKYYGKLDYTYGSTDMDKKAMALFLKNNCPAAYKQYMSGKKCIAAGWALFSLGMVFTAAGTTALVYADENYNDYYAKWCPEKNVLSKEGYDNMCTVGLTLVGVGPTSIVASIPCLAVGYKRCNKQCVDIFNNTCATTKELTTTLSVISSNNGLGIALNF